MITKTELREQLKTILAVANPTNFVPVDDEAINRLIDEFIDSLVRYSDQDASIRR